MSRNSRMLRRRRRLRIAFIRSAGDAITLLHRPIACRSVTRYELFWKSNDLRLESERPRTLLAMSRRRCQLNLETGQVEG
jgi:hypothetical protein